ncbi:hypothetical protein GH721_01380 [Kriegella sp. EG-1]|nr:hypothetical protein [Flavobacteriaceae bacterium EG-1]
MIIYVFILSLFSCSKDSDLLSEYVAVDNLEANLISSVFIEDNYVINGNDAIILDVLSNDVIADEENVEILTTSQPENGVIQINEDNTLTYVPNSNNSEDTTDNFTYTTQTSQEDGSNTTTDTKVAVTKINDEVKYWQRLFDDKWKKSDFADAISKSKSANKNQEYYFLAYYIDGLTSTWQATGDSSYLNDALTLINNTMDDAVSVGNGYLGWPAHDGVEYNLWDAYYWRQVATLIRKLYQSPNLRASGYQENYERILDFSEKNIWNRYFSYGNSSIYRSRTHMASHWARIGMELYIVTGNEKYKEVFDNISFGEMPGRTSNLKEQLYENPKNSTAYAWDSHWGSINGSEIQDTNHAGAIISFWVLAYENNMYWTEKDINSFIKTLDIVWPNSTPKEMHTNVDGTGGFYHNQGRLHEWFYLGRFNQELQNRLKKDYIGNHLEYYGTQVIGIAALNAKILVDGSPYYPEN